MGLLIEKGVGATLREVCDVPPAKRTATYEPVPNQQLIEFVKDRVDTLFNFPLVNEQYALARKENHMFGLLAYDTGVYGRSFGVGLGNSKDRSLSLRSCGGAQVNVCTNTCMSGDSFVEVRRHTKNVWKTFTSNFDEALEKMLKDFENMNREFELMENDSISQREGYALIGVMRGENVLLPQQETFALKAWDEPEQKEFEPRNLWSLYNACTEGTKHNAPDRVFKSLESVHGFFRELVQEKVAA